MLWNGVVLLKALSSIRWKVFALIYLPASVFQKRKGGRERYPIRLKCSQMPLGLCPSFLSPFCSTFRRQAQSSFGVEAARKRPISKVKIIPQPLHDFRARWISPMGAQDKEGSHRLHPCSSCCLQHLFPVVYLRVPTAGTGTRQSSKRRSSWWMVGCSFKRRDPFTWCPFLPCMEHLLRVGNQGQGQGLAPKTTDLHMAFEYIYVT